jgi:hypothetical protein
MPAPQGHCWLCNRFGPLTKEHIPPKRAYNDCPLLLAKVDERSSEVGNLFFSPHTRYGAGLCFHSLCSGCNNRYGSKYAGAYVDLVKTVSERIQDIPNFHKTSILGVKRPLRILKQVMLQFVTANGPGFVRSNDWVAPFVRNPTNNQIPDNIGIYLFASNMRGARTTGVSAHIDLASKYRRAVVAEFTFWPLGTVISFDGELSHARLTPVHQWARYRFDYEGSVDLDLSVNPTDSAYPLDFRTPEQIKAGADPDLQLKVPTEEDSRDMMNKAIRASGESDNWIYSGHPKTVNKVLSARAGKGRS